MLALAGIYYENQRRREAANELLALAGIYYENQRRREAANELLALAGIYYDNQRRREAANELLALAGSAAPVPMVPAPSVNTAQSPTVVSAGSDTAKRITASHPVVSSRADKKDLKEGIDHFLLRFNRQRHLSRELGTIKGAARISQKVLGVNVKRGNRRRLTLFTIKGMHLAEHRDLVRSIMCLLKDSFHWSCWPQISSLESQEGLIACGVKDVYGDKVLGIIILKPPDKNELSTPMLIPWLCAREAYRSCGIGSLLMQMARQIQIHQMGRIDIFLIADHESEGALRFYHREGFVIINWNDNEKINQIGTENDYIHDHNTPMRLLETISKNN